MIVRKYQDYEMGDSNECCGYTFIRSDNSDIFIRIGESGCECTGMGYSHRSIDIIGVDLV